MSGRAHLAVILARGLGTRMRRDHDETELDAAQQAAAKHGRKAMMPVAGRRFSGGGGCMRWTNEVSVTTCGTSVCIGGAKSIGATGSSVVSTFRNG